MKTFKEYYLDVKTVPEQTIYMPIGAEVVCARSSYDSIILDTLIDVNEHNTSLRSFKVCAIGENLYTDAVKYISQVLIDSVCYFVVELL